jgi:hypothetical protein
MEARPARTADVTGRPPKGLQALKDSRHLLLSIVGGAFVIAAAIGAASPPAATGSPLPPGAAVLARGGADALVIWDASGEIAGLIGNKSSAETIMRRVESDAALVLGDRSKSLSSGAKMITVRVVYQRTGAISPAYQTATFQGIENLVSVKAPVSSALVRSDKWADELRNGKIPDEVTVTVSGKLPSEVR